MAKFFVQIAEPKTMLEIATIASSIIKSIFFYVVCLVFSTG
jgi:hypothetical protein